MPRLVAHKVTQHTHSRLIAIFVDNYGQNVLQLLTRPRSLPLLILLLLARNNITGQLGGRHGDCFIGLVVVFGILLLL